jgi:hypothetical protein
MVTCCPLTYLAAHRKVRMPEVAGSFGEGWLFWSDCGRRSRMDYRSKSKTLIAILLSLRNRIALSVSWFLRYKYLLPILLAFFQPSDVKTSEPSLPKKVSAALHSGAATLSSPENSCAGEVTCVFLESA